MEAKQPEPVQPKTRRPRRDIPSQDKCKAVLAVWTECRKISDVCRDLAVSRIQVDRWEEQALEGMLKALESRTRKTDPEQRALSSHLEKLMEKRLPKRLNRGSKLDERLEQIQSRSRHKETAAK